MGIGVDQDGVLGLKEGLRGIHSFAGSDAQVIHNLTHYLAHCGVELANEVEESFCECHICFEVSISCDD